MAKTDSTSKPTPKPKSGASAARVRETLAEARVAIYRESAKDARALSYLHSWMAQIAMPRSPQKGRTWTSHNGELSMAVTAGEIFVNGELVQQPLPQGPYARLILADISAYAIRHQTPTIDMERSASEYMRTRLGLHVNAGKRGTRTAFKREALALSAAGMYFSHPAAGGGTLHVKLPPIGRFHVMNDEGWVWPRELGLTVEFFESLREHAVPIDMRAYRALAHSALAQDIYAWLAQRLYRLEKPVSLPWSLVAEQFGGYSDVKRFREEFIKRLREVHEVYQDARVDVAMGLRGRVGGALVLRPSKPPIPRTQVAVPAGDAPKAPPRMETREERQRRQQVAHEERERRRQQLAVRRREAGALRVVEGDPSDPKTPD